MVNLWLPDDQQTAVICVRVTIKLFKPEVMTVCGVFTSGLALVWSWLFSYSAYEQYLRLITQMNCFWTLPIWYYTCMLYMVLTFLVRYYRQCRNLPWSRNVTGVTEAWLIEMLAIAHLILTHPQMLVNNRTCEHSITQSHYKLSLLSDTCQDLMVNPTLNWSFL